MSENPRITIDLTKLTFNTRAIVNKCEARGVKVLGVTKAVCGDPRVGLAMLKGGVAGLADARIQNIKRLSNAGIKVPLVLLRSPMVSEIDEVIVNCSISLNSEPEVLAELSKAALDRNTVHQVILMIDVGEIREGILPANIFRVGKLIKGLKGVRVIGVGTNLSCYSGVRPTPEHMGLLLATGCELEKVLGYKMTVVSGGNSSGLELIEAGLLPEGINQFRIGESILLGRYIGTGEPIKGTSQDAFVLAAEMIELKEKPSVPAGELGNNVFGEPIENEKFRIHFRGIAAIGRQDVPPWVPVPLGMQA